MKRAKRGGFGGVSRVVYGVHPVAALLDAGRCEVHQVIVGRTCEPGRFEAIERLAVKKGIKVLHAERKELDEIAGTRANQGVVALCGPYPYVSLEDLFSADGPGPILVMDMVQDPQNLGAVVRSALFFGARGIVIPKSKSAHVTGAVAKASAGATEYMPIARVGGTDQSLRTLKSNGFWILGAEADGDTEPADAPWEQDCALLLGGEDAGLRRVLRSRCDMMIGIRGDGEGVTCLNVASAAGVLLYAAWVGRKK